MLDALHFKPLFTDENLGIKDSDNHAIRIAI